VALIGLGWCLEQAGERAEATTVLRRAAEVAWQHESRPETTFYMGGPMMIEVVARYLIPLLDPERDAPEFVTLRQRF
jgi:hypothetical protein